MKVLFVTHVVEMGGANRSMLQLIIELRQKYQVECVVLCPDYSVPGVSIMKKLQEIGVETISAPIRFFKIGNCNWREKKSYLKYLWRTRTFYCRLENMGFDLIHSNSSVIDFGAYLSHRLKVRHVWHLREFGDLDFNLHSVLGDRYCRRIYGQADAFIAISERIRSHFSRVINPSNIHTIYNGICPSENLVLAPHVNDVVQFICAGVMYEAKNQMEILRAVAELSRRGIAGFHVTLVGISTPEYLLQMRTYIGENHLDPFISILDEVDGIQQLLSHMDVGIMSSKCEAFGRVTVEYMLQNLAVIANGEGANPEILEDGVTGYIYQLGNPASLADKMQICIEDKVGMIRVAESGRCYANQHFLSQYNTASIYQLYKSILS